MNYFEILGVPQDATPGEIKKAYRRKVFQFHPDYAPENRNIKYFHQILQAYQVLINPVQRVKYISRQTPAVTDHPGTVLNAYWDWIFETGLREK